MRPAKNGKVGGRGRKIKGTDLEDRKPMMNARFPTMARGSQPTWIVAAIAMMLLCCRTTWADTVPLTAAAIFDPAHLVEVSIDVDEKDWRALRGQSRDFLSALAEGRGESPFTYFPADVTIDGVTIRKAGIRKKGFFGSLDRTRPSLKIKFDEYEEQAPAVGFDRLTLNNNKQDPSLLSQYLSYKLFNDSGTVAPRCNFAKVTVNGEYLGIYSNVESVKSPFLQHRFGDDSGGLFEGTVADFFVDYVERFEKKNAHAKDEHIRALAELLADESFTLDEVGEHLDVPAFVKFWATESLLGFWDGYTNNQNNFFVYRHPRTHKFLFIPWGTDSSFANSMPIPPYRISQKSVHSQSVLANRLYRHPEIQTLYAETMDELLKSHWNEDALIADIDRVAKLLDGHLDEGNRKFAKSTAAVKSFIRKRREVITNELKDGVVVISHGPRRPAYFKKIGTATSSFSTQWYDKSPKNPIELGEANLDVTISDEAIEFRQLGVTAEPSRDKRTAEADGRMPPTIVFTGRRQSDGKRWMLAVGTSSDTFRPSPNPVPVFGLVIEGNPLFFFARMIVNPGGLTMAGGTATFDQAGREPGTPVSGKLDLSIGRFFGGKNLSR